MGATQPRVHPNFQAAASRTCLGLTLSRKYTAKYRLSGSPQDSQSPWQAYVAGKFGKERLLIAEDMEPNQQ